MPVYFPGSGLPGGQRAVGIRQTGAGEPIYDESGLEWVANPETGILRVRGFQPGVNHLIRQRPTIRLQPIDYAGNLTCTTVGTAAFSVSATACPLTGLKMLQIDVPAGDNSVQEVRFYALAEALRFAMSPNDIWQAAIRLESDIPAGQAPNCFLRTSDLATPSGTRYRQFGFGASMWRPGSNILSCLNVETLTGPATYNVLGTVIDNAWSEDGNGGMLPGAVLQAVALRFSNCAGLSIKVGAIATAQQGWSRAVYVGEVDDVPESFWELAVPEYEKRRIPVTFNVVPGYMRRPGYMTLPDVHQALARGHEVAGHAWFHENSVADSGVYANALEQAGRFWCEQGIETGHRSMAWVQNDNDASARDKARDAGIYFARGAAGRYVSPLCPTAAPLCVPSVSTELPNSWQADALIHGARMRGQIVRTYQHTTREGGEATPTYPGPVQHYLAHIKRQLDYVYAERELDNMWALTWTDTLRVCGIDPMRGPFKG